VGDGRQRDDRPCGRLWDDPAPVPSVPFPLTLHQGHVQRPGLLCPGTRGAAQAQVSHLQVPDHGAKRRRTSGIAPGQERAFRPGLQDQG